MTFSDLSVLIYDHVVLPDTTGSLSRLQKLPAVEYSSKNTPAWQGFLDRVKSREQGFDHCLFLIAQVWEAGRTIIIAKKIEAEREVAFKRELDNICQPIGIPVSDGHGQMGRPTFLNELSNCPRNEMKRGLSIRERPLYIVPLFQSI